MKLETDTHPGQHRVDAYSTTAITVGGTAYRSNIIVTTETVIADRLPAGVGALAAAHVDAMLEFEPEIVLFGTGAALTLPGDEVYQLLYARNTGFETMDTGAACRVFNFLAGEERRVVAALFMMG